MLIQEKYRGCKRNKGEMQERYKGNRREIEGKYRFDLFRH